MPVQPCDYRSPFLLSGGHSQTILPSIFRSVAGVRYRRERIDTPDGDFLDLDRLDAEPAGARVRRLAVLCHGLEGSSRRPYVMGMARAFSRAGWDVIAWNYRGCSGEPNRRPRSYHSGATDDLDVVIRHALALGAYDRVALVGFSLGGNLALKYVGERGGTVDDRIAGVAAFSAPCDLRASADSLARFSTRIYMGRFIASLGAKIREKAARFPGAIDLAPLDGMRTFHEFDDRYTAPLHGFSGAADYWEQCSSVRYLGAVRVPALLVSALNDPFLAGRCYPVDEAERNPCITLEMPRSGGHIGFISCGRDGTYWSERRALAFLDGPSR